MRSRSASRNWSVGPPSASARRTACRALEQALRAASRGKRAARPGLVLQAVAGEPGQVRVGFTVTKKVGNAVVRNRARRRLKEAVRLSLPTDQAAGWDLVLIGRDGTGKRPFAKLIEDLRGALKQAGVVR